MRELYVMSQSIPVACTLTPDQLRFEATNLLPGLIAEAASRDMLPDGIRLSFQAAPGRLARIAAVIDRERVCCRFLRFTLRIPEGERDFELDISGPEGTRELVAELTLAATPVAAAVTSRSKADA